MALKPYLQLIRLPNVFTAAADSLAGWLLVRGTFDHPRRWLPLLACSMAIYAAGIALNDVFDYAVDLKELPPSAAPFGPGLGPVRRTFGRVVTRERPRPRRALSGSMSSAIVASALALCVLAYDAGVKRTVLGPELMGACRGLNLVLGMSQDAHLGGPVGWLAAGSLALFVAGVTWISRSETETGRTRGLSAGLVLENLAVLGLLAAALQPRSFPSPTPDRPIVAPEGLLVLLLAAWVVNLAGGRKRPPARSRHAATGGQDGSPHARLARRWPRRLGPGRPPSTGRRGFLGPGVLARALALFDLREENHPQMTQMDTDKIKKNYPQMTQMNAD